MSNWFKEIFTKNGIMSSKRVCGVLGFLTCLGILIYCTILVILAPTMIDIFLLTSASLLGVDSVTDIWKKDRKKSEIINEEEEIIE